MLRRFLMSLSSSQPRTCCSTTQTEMEQMCHEPNWSPACSWALCEMQLSRGREADLKRAGVAEIGLAKNIELKPAVTDRGMLTDAKSVIKEVTVVGAAVT